MGRYHHSSVLINISTGPHLLVMGGYSNKGAEGTCGPTNDCWLFDINKRVWKQLVSINNLITIILMVRY